MVGDASTHLLRQGHRAPAPDDLDHVPARPRLRGPDRRAARCGRERGHRGPDRGRLCAVPAVRLRQARAARDGSARGHAGRGAGAARDDRPPVRAGRPAEADGRGGRHAHAERLRARARAQVGHRLRDDRHHGPPLAGRARGRDGARAHARRQPRRARDDARLVLRDHRRLHRPVRLLLRRRRRRRRQPQLHDPVPRLDRRLHRLVLPHAGALALPRVRRRPWRGADHRPPQRARLGADADLERHAADPAAGPARDPGARGVLHLPARRRQVDRRDLRDAPADGEADRGAPAPGDAAAGHRLMGLFDILTGKRKMKAPAESRLFAMSTAAVTLEMTLELRSSGKAAIVFQPLATADFSAIVNDMEEVLRGTGEDTGTQVERTDDSFGYRWMVLSDDDFEDLVVGINVVSQALQDGGYGERILCAVFAFRDAQDQPVYWIYNYKRGTYYPFVPAGGEQRRDSERELRLKAQIGHELPVEAELERWFPLWGIPI